MKKFLTITALAIGIIFAGQLTNISTVSAEEIYVGSADEIDFYITSSGGGNRLSFDNALWASVTAYSNNEAVDSWSYIFSVNHPSSNGKPVFQIVRGKTVSQKQFVEEDPLAKAVLVKLLSQ